MDLVTYLMDKYYYGTPLEFRPLEDILTDLVKDLGIIYVTVYIIFIIGRCVKNLLFVKPKPKLICKATQTTFIKKDSSTQTESPHTDTLFERFGAMGEPNPF